MADDKVQFGAEVVTNFKELELTKKQLDEIRGQFVELTKVTERYNAETGRTMVKLEGLNAQGEKIVRTMTKTKKSFQDNTVIVRDLGKATDELVRAKKRLQLVQRDTGPDMRPQQIMQTAIASSARQQGQVDAAMQVKNLKQELAGLDGNNLNTVATGMGRVEANTKAAKQEAIGLGLTLKNIARIVVISAIHRSVGRVSQTLREATEEAMELQIAMSEIRTISQGAQISFGQLAVELRQVSDEFGLDVLDTAEAQYQALSNQVAEGAEAFQFLESAARFSIAAVASQEEAVSLLSSAIKAYNLDVSETEKVSAQFFKTIELGRVRASEMADTIGNILVPANQLGVGLDEVNSAITTLTVQGVKYNQAATLIRNVILKLIRPTDEMSKLLRETGFESGQAAVEALGFGGVLEMVQEKTQGSATEIGKLFSRIRAIVGVLGFAGESMNTYNNNLEEIRGSTESFNKAVEIGFESNAKKIQVELNKVANFFEVDLGQKILANIVEVSEEFGGLSKVMINLANVIDDILAVAIIFYTKNIANATIATIANTVATRKALQDAVAMATIKEQLARAELKYAATIEATTAAQAKATAAAKGRMSAEAALQGSKFQMTGVTAGGAVAIATTIALAVVAFRELQNFIAREQERVASETVDVWIEASEDILEVNRRLTQKRVDMFNQGLKETRRIAALELAAVLKEVNATVTAAGEGLEDLFKGVEDSIKTTTKSAKQELDNMNKELTKFDSMTRSLESGLEAIRSERINFALDVDFSEGSPVEQLERMRQAAIKLSEEGGRRISSDPKLALELFKRSRDVVAKMRDLMEKTNADNVKNAAQLKKINEDILEKRRKFQDANRRDQLLLQKAQEKGDEQAIETIKRRMEARKEQARNDARQLFSKRGDLQENTFELPELNIEKAFEAIAKKQKELLQAEMEERKKEREKIVDDIHERERKQIATTAAFRKALDTEDLISDLGDVTSIEELRSNRTERIKALRDLAKASQELGVDEKRIAELRMQAQKEMLAFDAQARKIIELRDDKERKDLEKSLRERVRLIQEGINQLQTASSNIDILQGFGKVLEQTTNFSKVVNPGTITLAPAPFSNEAPRVVPLAPDTRQLQESGIFGNQKIGAKQIFQLEELRKLIEKIGRDPGNATDTQIKAARNALDFFIENAEKAGTIGRALPRQLVELQKILGQRGTDIPNLLGGAGSIPDLKDELVRRDAILKELTEQLATQQNVNIELNKEVTTAVDSLVKNTVLLVAEMKRLGKLRRPGDPIDPSELKFGGIARFAAGGMAGTDMIPALLSPGEFVMNAASTRRFHGALTAMNSDPARFASGGMTSTTNSTSIGDINITMSSSGNEAFDVNRMGQLLRREIRKGTLKF